MSIKLSNFINSKTKSFAYMSFFDQQQNIPILHQLECCQNLNVSVLVFNVLPIHKFIHRKSSPFHSKLIKTTNLCCYSRKEFLRSINLYDRKRTSQFEDSYSKAWLICRNIIYTMWNNDFEITERPGWCCLERVHSSHVSFSILF